MSDTEQHERGPAGGLADELPLEQLKEAGQDLLEALVSRAVGSITGRISDLTDRLTRVADNGGSGLTAALTGAKDLAEGKSPLKAALNGGISGAKDKVERAVGSGGSGGTGNVKVVNIVEEFDVGLPLRVAYNQWTTFEDYPSFTRKVEKVEQESDEKIQWRTQIFFSHRDWESTIVEQIPDERIVWKSTGAKGYVDGAVTFHELAPTMTRILLVLEYHPQGFFEKTANLWRAQGRRVRSDFKHIKRHMMTRTILDQDEAEGWRGEIRDEEVVRTHEEALDEEQHRDAEAQDEDEFDAEPDDGDADEEAGSDDHDRDTARREPARSSRSK
ncbi:putative membrane protein [Prauserella sediminis]|uniref:Putative membrane protein n=1 Tax=Prauserella sediminis TaxID=577680 RepID=A0A839XLL4_9PSEU|nr:SRPBCC family protein [Prauserella sediminis]MBB3661633.1 putative membrane protein [Prauserella sediminis]